jgi:hypothetical protein
MAINIGSQAVNAIQELRGNRDFERMIDGLGDVVQTKMQRSMDVPSDQRIDQTAHARGMWDVWEALHAAYHNLIPAQVKPPPRTMGRKLNPSDLVDRDV